MREPAIMSVLLRSLQLGFNFRIETGTPNSKPVVGAVTVSPNPVQVNTAVSASATYSDPDAGQSHTATVNWGDGSSPTSCTVIEATSAVSCSRPGGYTGANVYPVTLSVSDGSVTGTSQTTYVSVYDPTQSSVFIAGTRFNSPAGALTADPTRTGVVQFGLSYKYKGRIPVGNRQFVMDFINANLHFNATSVSSLVLSNGKP